MLTINPEDNHDRKSIVIADDSEMSMKVLQNFYAKVTGKKEQLSKSVQINHRTTFEDLENLHHKMIQACGPLILVQRNESVVVYHADNSKEQFSSFDSFRRYNKSLLSPVENVHIEYNVLIKQQDIADIQSYKFIIDIHSRVAILKKAADDSGSMPNFIYHMVAKNTGNIKINYVDYVVATGFASAIDQWFQSLHHENEGFIIKSAKSFSHNFSFLFKYISVSVFLSVCYSYFGNFYASVPGYLGVAIIIFGSAYVLGGVSGKLGSWVESSVDSIYPLSYVKLNRGDEKLISEQVRNNKYGYFRSVAFSIFTIILNVVSSILAVYLGFGG